MRHIRNLPPLTFAVDDRYFYSTIEGLEEAKLMHSLVLAGILGVSIPCIVNYIKIKQQRRFVLECVDQIGRLDKNAIEDKIERYYVDGKISEENRRFLKDKISEYYEKEKS